MNHALQSTYRIILTVRLFILIKELRSSDLKPTFGKSLQYFYSGSRNSIFITKCRKQEKNMQSVLFSFTQKHHNTPKN